MTSPWTVDKIDPELENKRIRDAQLISLYEEFLLSAYDCRCAKAGVIISEKEEQDKFINDHFNTHDLFIFFTASGNRLALGGDEAQNFNENITLSDNDYVVGFVGTLFFALSKIHPIEDFPSDISAWNERDYIDSNLSQVEITKNVMTNALVIEKMLENKDRENVG